MNGEFLSLTSHLLPLIYPIFTCVDPYSEYGSTSAKFLNTDPIWIRIHKTLSAVVLISDIVTKTTGSVLLLSPEMCRAPPTEQVNMRRGHSTWRIFNLGIVK